MKKSIIATAVAAGMLATGAAQASPTVYGILHLSIDTYGDDHIDPTPVTGGVVKAGSPNMVSHTSAIGIKGSEDLGNGLKAIYKAEFKVEPFIKATGSSSSLERRDVWIGLKGGWGKAAVGTMSSNYKQMGGKIDPLYRTEAEGRGIVNMQSGLHGGSGINGGRMEQAIQYTTPKMAGIEVVVNTTVAAADAGNCTGPSCDESMGIGIRWSNKNFLLYADYFDPNAAGSGPFGSTTYTPADESVSKVGGKWSNKAFQVSGQYELTEDQTGGDYIFLNGLWNINNKNAVTVSWGQQDKISDAYALAYVFSMSKQTNVYAGYASVSADTCTGTGTGKSCSYNLGVDENGVAHEDGNVITLGLRKSF